MNRIDLHTHTTASDGSLTPQQLISKAKLLGLTHIAVTDHDTINGLDEALEAGSQLGVEVIPGVELSVDFAGGSMHLLAYGLDHSSQHVCDTLDQLRNARNIRNDKIVKRLQELGYRIDIEDVLECSSGGTVGRGHIAKVLVNSEQVATFPEVFDNLIGKGAIAYVDRYRLEIGEACRMIHDANGISVWAHPGLHERKLEKLFNLLPQWVEMGLDGIESDYNLHTIALRDQLRNIATQHGLIYTGGSDFHGSLKPDVILGDGPENQPVDPSIIQMIRERLALVSK